MSNDRILRIKESTCINTSDAIRERKGTQALISPENWDDEIRSIESNYDASPFIDLIYGEVQNNE